MPPSITLQLVCNCANDSGPSHAVMQSFIVGSASAMPKWARAFGRETGSSVVRPVVRLVVRPVNFKRVTAGVCIDGVLIDGVDLVSHSIMPSYFDVIDAIDGLLDLASSVYPPAGAGRAATSYARFLGNLARRSPVNQIFAPRRGGFRAVGGGRPSIGRARLIGHAFPSSYARAGRRTARRLRSYRSSAY